MYLFSAQNTHAVWGPLSLLPESDPDAALQLVPLKPMFRMVEGIDGVTIRVRAASFPAQARISVLRQSRTFVQLVQALKADALFGLGAYPFLLTDRETGVGYSAPNAYLTALPAVEVQNEANFADWQINLPNLSFFGVGGSSTGLVTGPV